MTPIQYISSGPSLPSESMPPSALKRIDRPSPCAPLAVADTDGVCAAVAALLRNAFWRGVRRGTIHTRKRANESRIQTAACRSPHSL